MKSFRFLYRGRDIIFIKTQDFMSIKQCVFFISVLLTFQATTEVIAQQSKLDTLSLDEISRKLENPLSSLWSLTFQENYFKITGTLVDDYAASNNFFFQPFPPFPVGNMKMLVIRPVFPLVTQPVINPETGEVTDHITGLGDIQLFTAFGPDKKTGNIWGIGATFVFPTATDDILGQGKFQAGPAAMYFILGKIWTLGTLAQHWWSIAGDDNRQDVNQTDIQYIARRQIPGGWSIGMGPTISINWEAEEGNMVTFPIGLGITKTIRIGGTPIKMRLEPQYSIIKPDDYGTEWNIRFQFTPVINRPF
jgi:hypothetical protein